MMNTFWVTQVARQLPIKGFFNQGFGQLFQQTELT
jgi:hypothetical protein